MLYFGSSKTTNKIRTTVIQSSGGELIYLKNNSGKEIKTGDRVLFNLGVGGNETDLYTELNTTSNHLDKGSIFIDNDNVYVNYQNNDTLFRYENNKWNELDRKGWNENRTRGNIITFPHNDIIALQCRAGTNYCCLISNEILTKIDSYNYIGQYKGKHYVCNKGANAVYDYEYDINYVDTTTIRFNCDNGNRTGYIDEITGDGFLCSTADKIDFFKINDNGEFIADGNIVPSLSDSTSQIVSFTGARDGDYLFYCKYYDGKYSNNGNTTPPATISAITVYKIVNDGNNGKILIQQPDMFKNFANEDCFVNFDLRNDILTIGTRFSVYAYKFDRENDKFIHLPLNLKLPENTNRLYPYYFCVSPDLTRAIVTLRTEYNTMKIGLYTINTKAWEIVSDDMDSYNILTAYTGIATGKTDENGNYEIKCVLPQQIEVGINTDIDIADNEVIIEGGI